MYDCGYSLNVAIDVGQVEGSNPHFVTVASQPIVLYYPGGFIQALGLLFTEDCTTLDGQHV